MTMRPLPTHPSPGSSGKPSPPGGEIRTLELGPLSGATLVSNRRHSSSHGAYPWLLIASTILSAVFCFLYLTKPVLPAAPSSSSGPASVSLPGLAATNARPPSSAAPESLLPSASSLPGDASKSPVKPESADPRSLAKSPSESAQKGFEETNLRVQHVLRAQGPNGEDLGLIDLEVPALYQSRQLRWTAEEVVAARDLAKRIGDYQLRSRQLREEGQHLLDAWNRLIRQSLPEEALRADSPSSPAANAAASTPDTIQAIEKIR